jgi:hypothetical protein
LAKIDNQNKKSRAVKNFQFAKMILIQLYEPYNIGNMYYPKT